MSNNPSQHDSAVTNSTIKTQLSHRTIREFTDEPVNDEVMDTLFEVANRTATSRGLQQASIIWVTDPETRERLTEIGAQPYVGRAPIYLLFIIDAARNAAVLRRHGQDDTGAGSMKCFLEGFTDACLMAQNVAVAAESLGLGVNFLGNIVNDLLGVIQAVGLPRLTFPVLAMTLGWPNQQPQLKPRIPSSVRVMRDGYRPPADVDAAMDTYDAEMTTYYDLREANRRSDSFSRQLASKLLPAPAGAAGGMAALLQHQGFLPGSTS